MRPQEYDERLINHRKRERDLMKFVWLQERRKEKERNILKWKGKNTQALADAVISGFWTVISEKVIDINQSLSPLIRYDCLIRQLHK